MQHGFTDLPITVAIRDEGLDVVVAIHNDGIPIPPRAVHGIFDALVSSNEGEDAQPQSHNMGLGLYITKEIVLAHGGAIKVDSTEKYGTTFTARFPRHAEVAVKAQ